MSVVTDEVKVVQDGLVWLLLARDETIADGKAETDEFSKRVYPEKKVKKILHYLNSNHLIPPITFSRFENPQL